VFYAARSLGDVVVMLAECAARELRLVGRSG
jgi:hypothetical protein